MIRFTRRRKIIAAACGTAVAAAVWLRCGPLPAGLLDERGTASTVVLDRNGVPLYEALSDEGTRAARVEADRLPPIVAAATVAVEDRRFWRHPGVDPIAIARAAAANLRQRSTVEGGSNNTQQVAKLLLARQGRVRRGLRAKLTEAVVALRLEHRLSKREILALYLSLASYGNQISGVNMLAGRPK
jgi:penicillin-binding protein 1C